jgi:hypothetical protein
MLNYVAFVQKRAIAVRLSVQNMTMTTASGVQKRVVAVPNPAAKWLRQWFNRATRFCTVEDVLVLEGHPLLVV